MEGQRHNNPLNPGCFCLQWPKRDGLLTHAIVEAAKALGGSFKLVMLVPESQAVARWLNGYPAIYSYVSKFWRRL